MSVIRTPEGVKRRLDLMEKNVGKSKMIIDHGISAYSYSRYEYEEPNFKNCYLSKINIYVYDFDKENREVLYMSVTADMLKKPTKNDYFRDLVCCDWDKRFPGILYLREYEIR